MVLCSSITWHILTILQLKMGQPWLAGFSLLADPFLEHLDTFRDLDLVLDTVTVT